MRGIVSLFLYKSSISKQLIHVDMFIRPIDTMIYLFPAINDNIDSNEPAIVFPPDLYAQPLRLQLCSLNRSCDISEPVQEERMLSVQKRAKTNPSPPREQRWILHGMAILSVRGLDFIRP